MDKFFHLNATSYSPTKTTLQDGYEQYDIPNVNPSNFEIKIGSR